MNSYRGNYMSIGWISLHRSILDWEWYDDINTCRLFIHILLKANHTSKQWKGVEILRGQFVTSLDKLASEISLTKSQIRTSLNKLQKTHEIAQESTRQYTVITVISYDSYQDNDTRNDTRLTHESHTERTQDDRQIATTNNVNKIIKNKETINWSATQMSEQEISEIKKLRKNAKAPVTQRVVNNLAKQFELSRMRGFSNSEILDEWSIKGWRSFKDEWLKSTPKQSERNEETQNEIAMPTQDELLRRMANGTL